MCARKIIVVDAKEETPIKKKVAKTLPIHDIIAPSRPITPTQSGIKKQSLIQAKSLRKYAFITLCIAVIGVSFGVFRTVTNAQNDENVLQSIAQITNLPSEQPQIFTVAKQSQMPYAFLQNAQTGDKALLYYQAQKYILYRPSDKSIVSSGPLTVAPPRIFIRLGAAPNARMAEKIAYLRKGYTVTSEDYAALQNYARPLVIDLTGYRKAEAARIAGAINGDVSPLPSGESRADADILVILGTK